MTAISYDVAAAALSTIRPGDKLGNGLVAVPKQPTREMRRAGIQHFQTEEIYRAMICAAKETTR